MKVITEERLKEILEATSRVTSKDLLRVIIYECQEIDTLTVSELRSMVDAPINIPIIVKYIKSDELLSVCLSSDSKLRSYEGWLPMPIYKPEKE